MTEEYETVEMTVRVARESGETMATLTDRHGTHIDYHETSGGVRRALEALLPAWSTTSSRARRRRPRSFSRSDVSVTRRVGTLRRWRAGRGRPHDDHRRRSTPTPSGRRTPARWTSSGTNGRC